MIYLLIIKLCYKDNIFIEGQKKKISDYQCLQVGKEDDLKGL